MKLTFLGTGALDWTYEDCLTDGFSRHLTSAMLGDDTLIDAEPWLFHCAEKYSISLENVKRVFVTHVHRDHFSPDVLRRLAERRSIDVFIIADAADMVPKTENIRVTALEPYSSYTAGGMRIFTLAANHAVDPEDKKAPLHYIFDDGQKCLFWGCDGAWLRERTWYELRNHTFDMVVFDGTLGEAEGDERIFEHNNLRMVREMAAAFRRNRLLRSGGRIMINHMSKHEHAPHDILCENMKKHDIDVACDGMITEI